MDTGALKPAAAVAPVEDRRPTIAARDAVAPELSQAVTAATKPENSLSAANSRQPAVVLDPQTRELAYRSVDVRVRRQTRQAAEKAMLRERAYARAGRDKGPREEHDGESGFDTTA